MQKSFKQLYEDEKLKKTPAQQFVTEVAELTKKSETTVRMWLIGRQVPDTLTRAIIANHFGVAAETLFI